MQIQLNILDSKSADKARTFKLLVIKICLTMAWYDPIRIGIAQPTHQMAGQSCRSQGIKGDSDFGRIRSKTFSYKSTLDLLAPIPFNFQHSQLISLWTKKKSYIVTFHLFQINKSDIWLQFEKN